MPTPTTEPTANDIIIVTMGRPEADVEADGFEPRNALLRSPKQHVMKPPPPADPNVQRNSSELSTGDDPSTVYTGAEMYIGRVQDRDLAGVDREISGIGRIDT